MLRPPTHRADAPIVYVHPTDPAWDKDRIDRELKALRDDGKPESQHPVLRYQGGFTRYDVDAIADYLGSDATKFYFKRIGLFDWQQIETLRDMDIAKGAKPRVAYWRALSVSLLKVESGPTLVGEAGSYLPEDFERIAALNYYDEGASRVVDVFFDVGEAAYQASMPLSKGEKKA